MPSDLESVLYCQRNRLRSRAIRMFSFTSWSQDSWSENGSTTDIHNKNSPLARIEEFSGQLPRSKVASTIRAIQ